MYAERAYFDGDHCHHCATRDENTRAERLRDQARKAMRGVERRRGSRDR